jgi:hypothetical protein
LFALVKQQRLEKMRSLFVLDILALACAVLVEASSHGEAPGVGQPSDATNLYAFRSYASGRSNYVTILALRGK